MIISKNHSINQNNMRNRDKSKIGLSKINIEAKKMKNKSQHLQINKKFHPVYLKNNHKQKPKG